MSFFKDVFVHGMNSPMGRNTRFKLVGGGEADGRVVLAKEVQKAPVSREVVHVDLYEIKEGARVVVRVPVRLFGTSVGEKEGGIVRQLRQDVDIECNADSIPEFVELSVDGLELGQSKSVSDLELEDGLEAVFKHDFAIARILVPRGIEDEVAEGEEGEEGEEGAEGEEGEGADGDDAGDDSKTGGGE